MAFTAREVIMTFRGQNYLSGALRRIGADVGGLSRQAQLANQRAQMQIVGQRLTQSRNLARAEMQSVSTGSRRLALDRQRLQLGVAEQRQIATLRTIQGEQLRNERDQILNAERLATLERSKGTFVGRGLGRITRTEGIRAAQKEMQRLQEEAATLNMRLETQNEVIANSTVETQRLAAAETELATRQAQLSEIIHTRTAAIEENTIAMAANNFEAEKIEPIQAWQQRALAIEHAGRAMQMFGLIGTAALGFAAESAAKFQQQVTLAATQARPPGAPATVTAQIASQIQGQILSQMQRFPATAQEMSDSFYQIFSGTNIQNVKEAAKWVELFNKAAVGTGATLDEITQAGISIHNVFPGEFKNMTQALNVFTSAVRYGRMNASQFASALGYISPIAKDVRLSFKNVAEDMAFFTRQTGGRMTRQDAQGIARLIQLFGREDVTKGLAARGIAVFDPLTKRMRPLVAILTDIHNKLHLTPQETINFFKSISALGGKAGTQGTIAALRIFAQAQNNIKAYQDVTRHVRADNDELARSFEALSKTPGVQWQVFINQLHALVYMIGVQAIPAFIRLGQPIAKAVRWFNSLSDGTKSLIANILVFGSAGALVLGTILGIAGGLARVVLQLTLIRRFKSLENLVTGMRTDPAVFAKEAERIGANVPATAPIANRAGFVVSSSGEVTRAVSQSGAALDEAATSASTFRSAIGEIPVGTAAAVGGVVTLIGTMIYFHNEVGNVVGVLGGLQNTIELVSAAVLGIGLYRGIAGFIRLAEEAKAANTAILLTRASLLSMAGIAVTATIIILERHRIAGAIRTALEGETGIDPRTGLPFTHTGGGITGFLRRHVIRPVISGPAGPLFPRGIGGGIEQPQADAALQRLSQHYRQFLHLMGIPGTPKALEAFLKAMKDLGIDPKGGGDAFDNYIQRIKAQRKAIAESPRMTHFENLPQQEAQEAAIAARRRQRAAAAARLAALDKRAGVHGTTAQQTVQQWIQAVERARRAMLGAPHDVSKAKAYERIVADLNKRFKDQPALLAAINDVLQSYSSNLDKSATAAKKAAKAQQVSFEDVMSGVQNMYQNFLQQEQNIAGTLGQGPFVQSPAIQNMLQFGGRLTGRDYLRDLGSQLHQIENFHKALENLRRRGAPAELINQLRQMGPEALDMIKQIGTLSQPELQKYFGIFRTIQKREHQYAMQDLNNQLKSYFKYGRNIALQIIAGLKSEDMNLTKALERAVTKVFGKIPTQAQLDAAANKAGGPGHAGRHGARGGRAGTGGVGASVTNAANAIAGAVGALGKGSAADTRHHGGRGLSMVPAGGGATEEHTHYHVTSMNNGEASIMAQIRHADFVRRSKNRWRG